MSDHHVEEAQDVYRVARQHQWSAGGVSDYPPRDPLVGQRQFFETFRQFIHMVDSESDRFAHVFAIVADWGKGKSRLGYELIAQINDESPGWSVRTQDGGIESASLFYDDADHDQYLGLYIRYSQVASQYQNSENWFAFGLYRALLPLALGRFDGSIQAHIAAQAYNRLLVKGFDSKTLAATMELDQNHDDELLYEDPILATRLANAAYDYLRKFGINYILIVLDELETAAEAATFGLEADDLKRLDGRAIKLMGQAIKEEDPRRKLPWLRYVALCSPAIGEELREIQSTARRFELVELEHNAFSDVSDFVEALRAKDRLPYAYPRGLVEAAYAMSSGNFGWFNVIMAAVDGHLRTQRSTGQQTEGLTIGGIFAALIKNTPRVKNFILDHKAIDAIKTDDRSQIIAARELLYGQLPVQLDQASAQTRTLTGLVNEYDEPLATLYRRVEWDPLGCEKALRNAKFERVQERWRLANVEAELSLDQLLANLRTYAIHEPSAGDKLALLIPLAVNDFVQLVTLLYPHAAAEDAARALWRYFFDDASQLNADPTHIGPSVAMLARLNLRYRSQTRNSLIFRKPDASDAHDQAMRSRKGGNRERNIERLTGTLRVLDDNWTYDTVDAGLGAHCPAIVTPPGAGPGKSGGLLNCAELKLHPQARALLAWVSNREELERLINAAKGSFDDVGRTPVLALTPSIALMEQYRQPNHETLRASRDYMLLYQVSSTEEDLLERVGLPRLAWKGFELGHDSFTGRFRERIAALRRSLLDAVTHWRQELNSRGLIAWPLRAGGRLNDSDKDLLFNSWEILCLRNPSTTGLRYLDPSSGIDAGQVAELLSKLAVPPVAASRRYAADERAMLFSSTDDNANALLPLFLSTTIKRPLQQGFAWTFERARKEWFWGYAWLNARPKEVFEDWMALACRARFLTRTEDPAVRSKGNRFTLVNRTSLKGWIDEAENWLTGNGASNYPAIIAEIEHIYGSGRIRELFAPANAATVGVMTNEALEHIDKANKAYDIIAQIEESELARSSDPEQQRELIGRAAHHRDALKRHVMAVYDADEFKQLGTVNFKTISLEDDGIPLWKRIGQARAFASAVRTADQAISDQVTKLKAEIEAEPDAEHPFPRSLFTLSLDNVAHIVEGAVRPDATGGETAKQQSRAPGTLGHYLRKLEIDKATERVEILAKEVGYDFHTNQTIPIDEIGGHVLGAYRRLLETYRDQRARLTSVRRRLEELDTVLTDAPSNYKFPEQCRTLAELSHESGFVDDAFENLVDDAAALRERFIKDARMGDFRGLSDAVSLMKAIKNQLARILGDLQTIDNSIAAYRSKLLKKANPPELEAVNQLLHIKGKKEIPALTSVEVAAWGPLAKAVDALERRVQDIMERGDALLEETGISLGHWTSIYGAIAAGRDPELTSTEGQALVEKGLLVQTYRLGS